MTLVYEVPQILVNGITLVQSDMTKKGIHVSRKLYNMS